MATRWTFGLVPEQLWTAPCARQTEPLHWVAERGRWAVRTPRVVGLLLVHDRRLVLVKEASRKRAAAATPASTAAEKEAEALDVEKRLTVVLRLCAAGYLSKGYSQFGTSPLKDPGETEVRATSISSSSSSSSSWGGVNEVREGRGNAYRS